MCKTRVPGVAVLCFVSILIIALASRVYVLRELIAAPLFFSLLFWGIAMSLLLFATLIAASWSAIMWLTGLAALLGSDLRHPVVRPTTAGSSHNL